MVSTFRAAIDFFDRLGVYDVVLPFLLIFTIFFAILERTKIFGTDKIAGVDVTKKNLNAMTAFVIALLVVASSQIVSYINQSLAQIGLLLVIIISFLILAGSFWTGEEFKLGEKWKNWGAGIAAVAVLLVFAQQVGWLQPTLDYIGSNWDSTVVGSIILVILLIAFIAYVTSGPKAAAAPKEGG